MDNQQKKIQRSRIPKTPNGALNLEASLSGSLSAAADLLNTADFSDIANQATAAADAIMDDIMRGKEPTDAIDIGASGMKFTSSRRRGHRVANQGNLNIPQEGKDMELLDLDNESVLTAGSCEAGELSGLSFTQSIDVSDIVRFSGWHHRSQLEDIQSVGSRENGQADTAHNGGGGGIDGDGDGDSLSSFGPSSDEELEAAQGSSSKGQNGGNSRFMSPRSVSRGSGTRQQPSVRSSTRLSDHSDEKSRQPPSARAARYSQDLFPDIAIAGKAPLNARDLQTMSSADSQPGFVPNPAHLELTSMLKEAEAEVAELNRQVLHKNRHLEMAQAALVEYQDEVSKLCQRLASAEHNCRSKGPQPIVFAELEGVKADTVELTNQVSQMLDFTPAVHGGSRDSPDGLESLRIQNLELARQLQTSVRQEDVEHLENELIKMRTQRDSFSKELKLFKEDKRRLQSELLQAQEELMCVLSETTDADEEVKVYLHRLKESQSKQELLERDLKRTEADLQNLQKENMQLKAEARAWKAQSEGHGEVAILREMNDEMEKMRLRLSDVVEENTLLKRELDCLQNIPQREFAEPDEANKVSQLREALTVALQVNEYLKARQDELEEECETEQRWEEHPALQQMEQMQEMLDLALEANQLLGRKAEENAEVSAGLRCLASEVVALEADIRVREEGVEESRRRREFMELHGTDALVECNEQYVEEISKIRDALGRALEDKSDLEDRLDRKNHVVQELLARIDKLEQKVEDGANKAASSRNQTVLDIDSQGGVVTITSELRKAIETSEGEALRKVALQTVSRLEGVERQLIEALQDNVQLSSRLSGIASASAELEKVMKEDVKAGGTGSPDVTGALTIAEASRVSNVSDDETSESATRGLKRDAKGSSSGGRSARTVTISAVQFRNLRRGIRELTAEKELLQEKCEFNKGRGAEFHAELQKLQEELADALQHKAALARQFREFGHVRDRLIAEVEALKEALDEEQMKSNQIELALEDFRSLHVDLISIVDAGAEPVEDDEIPVLIPECIRFWAARVREDMVPLVSSSSLHASDSRMIERESPSLANVVVTAQAHAELDEPQPSPSRRSNIDSQSHMMTVLKNHVRDLREHGIEDAARLTSEAQAEESLHQTEELKARCDELHGARRQLDEVIGSKPASRGHGEEWEGEERDSIYGDSGTEGVESGSFDRPNPQDLQRSLQEVAKDHLSFGDQHHQIRGGRHLIDMDQHAKEYSDESHGPRSTVQEDIRMSFQDVLLNLESEIELLRQKKMKLHPVSDGYNENSMQPLTRELTQKISDLQGWADEIEAALMRKAEDLEADFGTYQTSNTLVKS